LNDRIYEWSIPAGLSGDTFRVRLTAINEPVISGQSSANFTIKAPFYSAPLNTNPGFSTTGSWEYGAWNEDTKLYCGPSESYDGSNIYDTNLTGATFSTADLTTTAIDCSGYTDVSVKFAGWFSVYNGYYAKVQVSNNGSTWTDLLSVTEVCAGGWSEYDFDISNFADGQSTVYVRWRHDDVAGSSNYAGMSVDNITFIGISNASQGQIFADGFENGNNPD
jgi:hypothetical protein